MQISKSAAVVFVLLTLSAGDRLLAGEFQFITT
jgi:hypothetical protein